MPEPLLNLVEGAWTPSTSDHTITVLDPRTDEPVTVIPAGSPADVEAAVAAAGKAAPGWARTAPAQRAGLLKQAASRLREHAGALAGLTTGEMGKPSDDAAGGVQAGIAAIEQYAELGPLHRGRSLAGEWGATDFMTFEPYGVAAVITPWNDPVAIPAQLVAAALVTGNAVVLKPSERTPGTAAHLVELIAADLPPGVLQLVHGDARAGAALAGHPDVELVLHVGSSATGRSIAEACARTGATPLLENGGKDALVVDAGVDPVWAAQQAALGAFANAGQICTAVERVYLHHDVAEPFLAALAAEAESSQLGPLVDRRLRAVVHGQVTAALDAGARLLTGGRLPDGPGAWYPATVLAGCTEAMAVMAEETFGPVAPVCIVGSYDEGLAAANRSRYGLAATVLTGSMEHAQQAWRELEVGTVKVNAVFGGAPGGSAEPRRGSGRGFGYGPELLDECSRVKVVHWQPPPA